MQKKDVIIIGAGAAGLMCAIEAGKRGRSVLVIEHADAVGKKIRISGGGRCNFTNINARPENYLSENPHFHKSALARYTPSDFIKLVEKHKIAYHEKKLGQLFCDGSSKEIISMLLDECHSAGVEIALDCTVKDISKSGEFMLETNQGNFSSASLIIATGGLSIPKMGATDFGHRLARKFGLALTRMKPGLVPLTFDEKELSFSELSGISVDSSVSCRAVSFRENILFTHRGLSGPSILQISSYWEKGDALEVDLAPAADFEQIFEREQKNRAELHNFLAEYFPKRFVQEFARRKFTLKPIYQYTPGERSQIANKLHKWNIVPTGTEGYAKAEVTCGGVDTNELSSKTMEAKKVPGLFFIGEVVDVTGWLGGYNFQWAWASGYAAGQYV